MNSGLPRRSLAPRWVRVTACVLVGFLSLSLAALYYIGLFNGNVRTVRAGTLYRSAQLRGDHLRSVLTSKQIRSVVSLRGYSTTDADLIGERSLCKRMGIRHIDIAFSARKLPPPGELRKLVRAFDTLPRPILVHCAGGADRSGLASTLFLCMYRRVPIDRAESDQLTWRYGHISFGEAHPMDDFFSLYRTTGRGLSIRRWILTRYSHVYAEHAPTNSDAGARQAESTGHTVACTGIPAHSHI